MGVSGVWLGVWLAQIFPALWLPRRSFRLLSDCETRRKCFGNYRRTIDISLIRTLFGAGDNIGGIVCAVLDFS